MRLTYDPAANVACIRFRERQRGAANDGNSFGY